MKAEKLAIDGGKPAHRGGWPKWPQWDEHERKGLLDVLESGKWWFGEKGEQFGQEFARMHDARFGIATTNGTHAAEIALRAIGIAPGDEVIVPPYTFVATATSVIAVNGVPVFADIDPDTLTLDPRAVEKAITPRTRAIMPVHLAGLPADMDALRRIARRKRLALIEDACHAWGTQWRGKGVGALGDAGVFSFQNSKNISAAEGGIILTNSKELAERCQCIRHCGRGTAKGSQWYDHVLAAGNYRITEFQAALLLAQLHRYPAHFRTRMRNAAHLNRALKRFRMLRLLREDDPRVTRRSYHLYVFRYIGEAMGGWPRKKFLDALKAEGVLCSEGYPKPLYECALFRKENLANRCPFDCRHHRTKVNYDRVHCPEAERVCREAVWLPHRVLLGSRKDMDDVVRAVGKVFAAMQG